MASWQVRVTVCQGVHNDKMPICIHVGFWFDESGSKNMLSKLSLLILKSCRNPIEYIVNWGVLEYGKFLIGYIVNWGVLEHGKLTG